MSKVLVEESNLTAIASAIRQKLGVQTTYKPGQMAAAIGTIHGEPALETLTANANGSYSPSTGKDGFSAVTVNVPNTYAAGDEGKVVSSGALVAQTARASTITTNGTYDTTNNNSVTVNVSGGSSSPYTIPAEYQEVEYLGFTGTQFATANISVQAYQILATKALIGSNASNSEQDIAGFDSSSSVYFDNNRIMTYGYIKDLPVQATTLYITRDVAFTYSASINVTRSDTLIIGQYKSTGSNPHPIEDGRVYAVRIVQVSPIDLPDVNNIYWFVPCVRKSDNVAGFYEVVNGTFHTNQGTGAFIVGPDV